MVYDEILGWLQNLCAKPCREYQQTTDGYTAFVLHSPSGKVWTNGTVEMLQLSIPASVSSYRMANLGEGILSEVARIP